MVGLARANNVAIMLTQFGGFKGGAIEVRQAFLAAARLGIDRLSLLLQVTFYGRHTSTLQHQK